MREQVYSLLPASSRDVPGHQQMAPTSSLANSKSPAAHQNPPMSASVGLPMASQKPVGADNAIRAR